MGSKKKAPPPPDYMALAKQQAESANQQLQMQTEANRPNQVNSMGSLTWSQDPATGAWTQTETLNPEILAAQQKALGLQTKQIGQVSDLMDQGGFKGGPAMPTYNPYEVNRGEVAGFDPNKVARGDMPQYDTAAGEKYAQRFTENLLGRTRPQQEAEQEQMQTKLRLQGLQPGTEAYDRAYKNLLTSQGDVNSQATLQGLMAGGQEARNIYQTMLGGQQQDFAQQLGLSQQDIADYQTQLAGQQQDYAQQMGLSDKERQDYAAQLAGQGQGYSQEMQNYLLPWQTASMTQGLANSIKTPEFQSFNTANQGVGTDVMGAAQQDYAQKMQAYNEAAQQKQAKGSSIGSVVGAVGGSFFGMPTLGASAGGALGGAFSDIALKDDIEQLSDKEAYDLMLHIHPYSFTWPNGRRSSGLLAQEVNEVFPHLVHAAEQGYLKVDYEGFTAILLGAFRHLAKQERENG